MLRAHERLRVAIGVPLAPALSPHRGRLVRH
jgi:hypothetical protein